MAGLRLIRVILLLFAVVVTAGATSARAEERLALVIGNGGYGDNSLPNARRDARLIAETLERLDFEVLLHIDADYRGMREAMIDFGDRLITMGNDTVALFFYAGHGVQIKGQNYLIPVGEVIRRESDVLIGGVPASWLLTQLQYSGSDLNLVILDACRDNPFEGMTRQLAQGLARMSAPRGTLIAYSTMPGEVAVDGTGWNSPYTKALAQEMEEPGVPLQEMFIRVRNSVMEETEGAQVPWEEGALTEQFYFIPEDPTDVAEQSDFDEELEFWRSVRDSDDVGLFEFFLDRYPDGRFSHLARLWLEKKRSEIPVAEKIFWDAIKDSDNVQVYRDYVERFPNGALTPVAKARIVDLTGGDGVDAEEERRVAALEAQREADEEARRLAALEAQREADEEARRVADEEARRLAALEAQRAADEEARRLAELEARRAADEEARRLAALEAQREADEEARRLAALEARREADEEARRLAALEAQREADEEARRRAELEAQREAEEETDLPAEINLAALSLAPLYHRDVQMKVAKAARKNVLRGAGDSGEKGRVVLAIDINPDGSVAGIKVLERSSAPERLIDTAVEAVKSVAPFDPYEASWIAAFSQVEITVDF